MHTLAKALLDAKDITLSNIPSDNEYPEVWVITHNLAYVSNGNDFLICRAQYKSKPDSTIVIGHSDDWNEIARHIYMLLLNRETDTICDNLEDDNLAKKVSTYIEDDRFFIELINEAVDIDGKKLSILSTNYIDDNETLEMLGEIVDACIEDYIERID